MRHVSLSSRFSHVTTFFQKIYHADDEDLGFSTVILFLVSRVQTRRGVGYSNRQKRSQHQNLA